MRWTPGTAATARCTPEVTIGVTCVASSTASPPVSCQEAATSPRVTASRTIPANDATVSARTRAKAGAALASEARAARVSARNPDAPARLA